MKAVIMHRTGAPDVLTLEEIERPDPAAGEVLIRVHAASVNPVDCKFRRGRIPKDLPAVLGRDISGTVEVSRAEGYRQGDEVFGIALSGGYAQFATAASDRFLDDAMLSGALAKKPPGVSHEQAAAIPITGLTAWQALFDCGGLQRGQTALIAGAAGGVGHFGVQFAKRAGARVIGTGSSRNRDFVLGIGADEYVDYTEQDVGQLVGGVDVVLDTVGGETTGSLVGTLRAGGVIVTIAAAPPADEAARARRARAEVLMMNPKSDQLRQIAELVAAGEVQVEVAHTLPLTEVGRAHELSESGRVRGKIILTLRSR